MKPLLLTLVLLLLAGSAGAGELQITTCSAGGGGIDHTGGETIVLKGEVGQCKTEAIHLEPDPCLATMEQAMKAMEPFIMRTLPFNPPSISWQFKHVDRHADAIYAWDAAKVCWSK